MLVSMRRLVLALAPTLAGCVPSTTCDEPGVLCLSSETAKRTQTGIGANAMASLDLDGDGALDTITAGEGTLSILWGASVGFSGTATTWSIDDEVAGLAVADFDGDGRLDLATALPRADAVAVLPGRGGRTFGEPSRHATGKSPRALIAADLAAGGSPELVTANLDDGTITVLRDFIAAPPEVVGPGPRALAAGDLDGDGDLDLAVALADADAVQILHGDGHGGLLAGPRHPVGAAPRSLALADLDDDGALDIAIADALDDTISILYADGQGSHASRKAIPTIAQPTGLTATKDADDRSILAVLSESSGMIARIDPRIDQPLLGLPMSSPSALAPGTGDLRYASPLGGFGSLSPGVGLQVEALWNNPDFLWAWPVDIDGDGLDELVTIDASAQPGALALRRSDGQLLAEIDAGPLDLTNGVLAADLTGDGRRDLVLWNSDVVVLVQQPDGLSFVAGPPQATGIRPQVGDIDGDGTLELLTADVEPPTSTLRWWSVEPTGALTASRTIALDFALMAAEVVRGDDDDRADLVLIPPDSQLYYLDAAASAPSRASRFEFGSGLGPIAFADLDGDGKLDGVGCAASGPIVTSDVLSSSEATSIALDSPCWSVHVADIDRDGALDVLVSSPMFPSRTRLTPFVRKGGHWTALGGAVIEDGIYRGMYLAQLDADGIPDLVFPDDAGVQAHRLSLGPALVESHSARLSSSGRPCLGDLDGDGATDLVIAGGDLGVALADRRGGFGPLTQYDVEQLVVSLESRVAACVLADFDADGTDELVIGVSPGPTSPAELIWGKLNERGDLTFTVLADIGPDLAVLAAADLDDDGALDLVGFDDGDPFTAHFFPGDGSGRFSPFPFISQAATPEPFTAPQLLDVDLDGRLDVVAHAKMAGFLVFLGRGEGLFDAGRLYSPLQASPYAFGDIDHNGRLDIVGVVASDRLVLTTPGLDRSPITLLDKSVAVAIADLDDDGRLELLAAEPKPYKPSGTGVLHIGRPRDDGRMVFTTQDVPLQGPPALLTSDFDGDGRLDVALRDGNGITIVRQSP